MSFFRGPKPNEVENWVCVMETNLEFEGEMAKNYLANQKIHPIFCPSATRPTG